LPTDNGTALRAALREAARLDSAAGVTTLRKYRHSSAVESALTRYSGLLFGKICEHGSLAFCSCCHEIVRYSRDAKAVCALGFECACRAGNLEVARWLSSRISKRDCVPFVGACEGGHLATAKWILERWGPRKLDGRCAMVTACQHGHVHVAKWLKERFHLSIESWTDGLEYAFVRACAEGHVSTACWLVMAFCVTDDLVERSGAYERACVEDRVDVARWLRARYHVRLSHNGLLVACWKGAACFGIIDTG